jgi:cell division protein FtsB
VLLAAVALIAGYFAFFGGEYGVIDSLRLQRERAREAERLAALKAQVDSLRARADSLQHDPEALERLARERYGLIKEGERLYRFD